MRTSTPWQGTDANEAAYNRVHNMLVYIILDGVAGISTPVHGHEYKLIPRADAERYVAKGEETLARFRAQRRAPTAYARRWMENKTRQLTDLVDRARIVLEGGPQKMTAASYDELRVHLGLPPVAGPRHRTAGRLRRRTESH